METAYDRETLVKKESVIQAIRGRLKHASNIQSENVLLLFTFSCNYLLQEPKTFAAFYADFIFRLSQL